MSKSVNYFDVFVPGGFPKYTYNSRESLALEEKVGSVLENLCKLAIVTGHTKSGKTVLVQKILPRDNAIWIDGGAIGDENDFWTYIIDQLGLFQVMETESTEGTHAELSGEASAEGGALIAKAKGSIGSKIGANEEKATSYSREITPRVTALSGLRKSRVPLVIDDFHYLPKGLQGNIIRALKPLVFEGIPVVVIAIPHRRYDAVKVEKEMTGRILPVNIPIWKDDELQYIPKTGFHVLNIDVDYKTVERLAKESIGSPHLMQEFCREICKIDSFDLENIFKTSAETIGRPIFEKLARGPRSHSDRKQRKLKSGQKVDIYGLVLHGLSNIKPGLITLEYEDLRAAIKEICIQDDIPNVQEVARVLKHMAQIAATDQSSTPVIDFDEEEKRLHITDPFFAFYLRWGDISISR
ncbi:MAG: ATP-binding protein [Patescibacteria group bacterium]